MGVLCLRRRRGERIILRHEGKVIGIITVREVSGAVDLGLDFPKSVQIHREELGDPNKEVGNGMSKLPDNTSS